MKEDKNPVEAVVTAVLDKQKELAKETEGKLELIQNNLDVLETKMVKNSVRQPTSVGQSMEQILNGEEYQTMVKNHSPQGGSVMDFTFTVPMIYNAAGDIKQPDNFVSGDAPVVLPFREAGVSKDPVRPLLVSSIIQWGVTSSPMVDWIERTAKTDGSEQRAEDAKMGKGDLTYTEKSVKVKITSEYMKVTNEALKDVAFLNSEINSELLSDVRLKVDDQLLNGTGAGQNHKGINTIAGALVPGAFATAITLPNEADVLRVAINQIFVDGKGKFFPNYILMHPTDVTKLDLLKIADGRYIEVPFYNGDKMSVARVPIIQNVGIGVGKYLVGDFNRAKAFLRDALTIRIYDQNEDDPLFNRSTVTANIRLAFRVKAPDVKAFVKGDFATDITALKKP